MLLEDNMQYEVGRHHDVNESTIRYIKKNEATIRNTVAVSFCEIAKRVITVTNKHIVWMESALTLWIRGCNENNFSLDGKITGKKVWKL